MAFVICPTCGEKGRLSKELVGKRIKCQKCGTGFQVTAPVKPPSTAVPSAPLHGDGIAVDGLEESAWNNTSSAEPAATEPGRDRDQPTTAFTEAPDSPRAEHVGKEYKLLTPKDKYFNNKFEIGLLEPALNHYARLGWVVRSMATPQVTGFSGGSKEELVVLLER